MLTFLAAQHVGVMHKRYHPNSPIQMTVVDNLYLCCAVVADVLLETRGIWSFM